MRAHTLLSLLYLCCLLTACASALQVSLAEVRAFADASASLGGYSELARRYRDTYEREQAYLSPGAERQARVNDAKRKLAYNDFVSVQKAVVF